MIYEKRFMIQYRTINCWCCNNATTRRSDCNWIENVQIECWFSHSLIYWMEEFFFICIGQSIIRTIGSRYIYSPIKNMEIICFRFFFLNCFLLVTTLLINWSYHYSVRVLFSHVSNTHVKNTFKYLLVLSLMMIAT